MKMMSYAENQEDVLLNRLFPEGEGFYIDVGANDPVSFSVTKHFYDRGWWGINVEPAAGDYTRLCAYRPRDINLNIGLSDREGTLTFREAPDRPGWASFSAEREEVFRYYNLDYVERTVPVTTLARLCEERGVGDIHFLKVDVEGHEREVIQGADWGRWRPRAVVVEATEYNAPETWEPIILGSGYLLATSDGLNRYYLREEDRDLLPRLTAPVSVLDNFIHHRYQYEIDSLKAQLGELQGGVDPASLALAQRLRSASRRHPRLAAAVKRVLRLVG